MPIASPRWTLALLATLLAQVALIALSVVCVAVYSYAIRTGETQEFYNGFAQASGPWVSLSAGGPVFFLIARWIRRRAPQAALPTAMAMLVCYVTLEFVLLLLWPGGVTATVAILPLVIGGLLIKAMGAWRGASGAPARATATAP